MSPRFLNSCIFLFLLFSLYPPEILAREVVLSPIASSGDNPDFFNRPDQDRLLIPDSILPPAPMINLQSDANTLLDNIAVLRPSVEESDWWNNLKKFTLDLSDPTIKYPKFIRFCLDAYNWAERVFNSYDPEYIESYRQHWKIRILNDDWIDSYLLTLPDEMKLHLFSNLYPNIGAYLHFMSFSIGYTYDLKKITHTHPLDHRKLEFSFNCATFGIESYYHEDTGNVRLGHFGNLKEHFKNKKGFPGAQLYTYGLDAYYFFNNKRYSHQAAYNFSIRQKESQGSFIAGFSYNNINASIDFTKFPQEIQETLSIPVANYKFHYNSYALLFGYGYNRVINPRLLFNVTVTPSIGLTHCYGDSLEGNIYMPSMNLSGRTSINYDLGKFFFCGILRFNGHWYKSHAYSLFSSTENFSVNMGFRF